MFFLKSSNRLYKFNNPRELTDTFPLVSFTQKILLSSISIVCTYSQGAA